MRVWKGLCLCLCALLFLSRCSLVQMEGAPAAAQPALEMLAMPPYTDREEGPAAQPETQDHLRVDLWLDASQVMGGVNEKQDSLYPHNSRKYRQGGFHYRFGNQTGWYESVLEDLLAAAEGSRVRVLRAGNERLTDRFLAQMGLSSSGDAARSLRRDMLTYAVDPMPDLFSAFSSESMKDSFYALGSPLLNQVSAFQDAASALLENPELAPVMSSALDAMIAAFAAKDTAVADTLSALGDDRDNPLVYALENIDLSRLSVITCDPAAFRRLSGTDVFGTPVRYIEDLVRERGIFDQGLSVGLYALKLDYMGQLSSFCAADFTDPLIWGMLNYNYSTRKPDSALPMPRILLMLLVGRDEQLNGFAQTLNGLLDSDPALQGLRGPEKGQLAYTAQGQTVTQQPFTFQYKYTDVARPGAGFYSQHTPGFGLAVDDNGGTVSDDGGLPTVTLRPDGQQSLTLTFSWPAAPLADGISLDLSQISALGAEVIDSLLLQQTLSNTKDAAAEEAGVQVLTLRDTRYLFVQKESPFKEQPQANPFALQSVAADSAGHRLTARVDVDAAKLRPGYYRVRILADITGEQLSWPAVPWTENDTGLSAEITNAQVTAWESLMKVITEYGDVSNNIPRQFSHAWGGADASTYKGTPIPDFPPVYKAPFLSRLLEQLRGAADVETAPYIRCVFDVFVPEIR